MTSAPDPAAARIAALAQGFELATRLAHARGHAEGLYPAQWAALRYFKTAVGERRTSMSLARYQGMAFGPVSRTVRTLIGRGLLRKSGSAGRGRSEAIEVTELGESLLALDPLAPLVSALQTLSPEEQAALGDALAIVLQALAGGGENEKSTQK